MIEAIISHPTVDQVLEPVLLCLVSSRVSVSAWCVFDIRALVGITEAEAESAEFGFRDRSRGKEEIAEAAALVMQDQWKSVSKCLPA